MWNLGLFFAHIYDIYMIVINSSWNPFYNPFSCSADPFKEASTDDGNAGVQEGLIHIRIQQRNGRKTLTTVQGISTDYDLKKIVKACKKVSDYWKEYFITR